VRLRPQSWLDWFLVLSAVFPTGWSREGFRAAGRLILAIPCLQVWADWASLRACMMSVRAQYASVGGAMAGTAGGVLTLAAAGRLAWVTGSAMATARRSRARHDDALALVGRPGPAPGVLLLDDDRPAVYCLPGRRRIVFTTGGCAAWTAASWMRSWRTSVRTWRAGITW
jgi:hypothetical protein